MQRRPPMSLDPYEKAMQIRARSREYSRKYMQQKRARKDSERFAKEPTGVTGAPGAKRDLVHIYVCRLC